MKAATFVAASILGLLSCAPATAQVVQKWSARGIFVFGSLGLDFETKKAKLGGKTVPLENCSSGEFYCARSELASVVLPLKCSTNLRVGDVWEWAGVRTRVAGTIDEPLGHLGVPGGVLYVLQSSDNPRVAFIYKRSSGVLSVLLDPSKNLDLSWTKPKGRGDYSELTSSAYWRSVNEALITNDPFGPCYG